jgi:hypothetical protein
MQSEEPPVAPKEKALACEGFFTGLRPRLNYWRISR